MPEPEDQPYASRKQLIHKKKKGSGDKHHHEYHRGGDDGFLAARPGDTRHLLTDLLEELDWTRLRHTNCPRLKGTVPAGYGPSSASVLGCFAASNGRSGGARTPNPRFWRPVLYQLSYTPTLVATNLDPYRVGGRALANDGSRIRPRDP